MGHFKPIWMTENRAKEDKAIAAVNRMADQGQLTEVACAAPLAKVACAAIERIDDEDALCKIAMPDGAVSSQACGPASNADAKDAAVRYGRAGRLRTLFLRAARDSCRPSEHGAPFRTTRKG